MEAGLDLEGQAAPPGGGDLGGFDGDLVIDCRNSIFIAGVLHVVQNCTKDLHLVLSYDGLKICKWSVDAAFVVHPDFKSHSGGLMMMSNLGGADRCGKC